MTSPPGAGQGTAIVSTADAWTSSRSRLRAGPFLDTWESLEVHKGDATLKITCDARQARHRRRSQRAAHAVNGHLLDFSRQRRSASTALHHRDTILVDNLETSRAAPRHDPADPHGWHTSGHVVTMTGAGVRLSRSPTRTPSDPLQRLFGIPVGTRRLQEGRPDSTARRSFVYLAHGYYTLAQRVERPSLCCSAPFSAHWSAQSPQKFREHCYHRLSGFAVRSSRSATGVSRC